MGASDATGLNSNEPQTIDPIANASLPRALPMHLNSLALIVGKMATMGLGFIVWLVAARLFAAEEVGLASGAVSAMMLCVQLALFGAGAAVISLLPRHEERTADVLDTAMTLVAVASLVVGGLFLLLATGLFRELSIVASKPSYAAAFLAMCFFGTLGVLLDQTATVLRRGDQMLARNAIFGVVTLGVLIGLPWLTDATSSLAILGAWVGGGLVSVWIGYEQLRRAVTGYRFRARIRRDLAARLVGIGLPNWALTVVERAPGAVMPIAVTELLSPETNAAWYAVWMMAWVVYIVPIQIGLSQFAEASHRPTDLRRVMRQGVRLSLGIGAVAATGAAILGPVMLSALGQTYAEAGTTPLRILVLVVFPFTFIQAYYSLCRSRNQCAEAVVTGLMSGSFGVGAAVLAGVASGLDGMAFAWLISQLATGGWAMWRLRAILRGSPAQPFSAGGACTRESPLISSIGPS